MPRHRRAVEALAQGGTYTYAIEGFGIDPKRTTFRSSWQKGTAERVVGSVRREFLDHVVVLGEGHLRRLRREYVDYYNAERVHTSIADAPTGRPVESRPSEHAKVIGMPRVGGLHHRYCWRRPPDRQASRRRSAYQRPRMNIENTQGFLFSISECEVAKEY